MKATWGSEPDWSRMSTSTEIAIGNANSLETQSITSLVFRFLYHGTGTHSGKARNTLRYRRSGIVRRFGNNLSAVFEVLLVVL